MFNPRAAVGNGSRFSCRNIPALFFVIAAVHKKFTKILSCKRQKSSQLIIEGVNKRAFLLPRELATLHSEGQADHRVESPNAGSHQLPIYPSYGDIHSQV